MLKDAGVMKKRQWFSGGPIEYASPTASRKTVKGEGKSGARKRACHPGASRSIRTNNAKPSSCDHASCLSESALNVFSQSSPDGARSRAVRVLHPHGQPFHRQEDVFEMGTPILVADKKPFLPFLTDQ